MGLRKVKKLNLLKILVTIKWVSRNLLSLKLKVFFSNVAHNGHWLIHELSFVDDRVSSVISITFILYIQLYLDKVFLGCWPKGGRIPNEF